MKTREEKLTGRGSPFELVKTSVVGLPCLTYRYGPTKLLHLYRRAISSGNRDFLVQGRRRLTTAELFSHADALALLLRGSFNVRPSNRVGILLHNRPEWLIGFVAITLLGATPVAPHVHTRIAETIAALEATDCSLVIADEVVARHLFDSGCRLPLITVANNSNWSDGIHGMRFNLNIGKPLLPSYVSVLDVNPEQLALIAFTSGSTGRSKGVIISHRGPLHGLKNMLLAAALHAASKNQMTVSSRPPVCLVVAPFSHVGGYANFLLMLYLGGKVVIPPHFCPTHAIQLINSELVTSFAGASHTMIQELLISVRKEGPVDCLRVLGIHGDAVSPRLLAEVTSTLPNVSVATGYGMTETNGTICGLSHAALLERPSSCGRALPTVDLRVVQKNGESMPAGQTGEVLVRGAMLVEGYCAGIAETTRTAHGGWFRTGDVGYVDSEGYLHITDRAANHIVCNGQQLSCRAVPWSAL